MVRHRVSSCVVLAHDMLERFDREASEDSSAGRKRRAEGIVVDPPLAAELVDDEHRVTSKVHRIGLQPLESFEA